MQVYCVEHFDNAQNKYVQLYFTNVSRMADYIKIYNLKDVDISTIVVDTSN